MKMLSKMAFAAALVLALPAGLDQHLGSFSDSGPVAHASGTTLVVTTSYDSGTCPSPAGSQSPLSLRCAIDQANLDGTGDTIDFNLPPYDCSGYQNGQTQTQPGQICVFTEQTPAYNLTASNTTVDGYSLPGTSPNSDTSLSSGDNADIGVELTGCTYTYSNAPCPVPTGLTVSGSGDIVEGLAFDGTNVNFSATSTEDLLEGDFIGVTPDGQPDNASPSSTTGGVDISGGSLDTVGTLPGNGGSVGGASTGVRPDVIVGSGTPCGETDSPPPLCGSNLFGANSIGVTIESDPGTNTAASGDKVFGNIFGLAPNGKGNLGNDYGMVLSAQNFSVQDNLVTNSDNSFYSPVQLCPAAGAAANGGSSGGGDGIFVTGTGTVYGSAVTNNQASGILVGCPGDTTTSVVVSENLVHDNGNLSLDLSPQGQVDCSSAPPGPNDYIPCPVITAAGSSAISGTATANSTVEVFIASNGPNEAQHGGSAAYLGSAETNGSGNWTLSAPFAASFDSSTQQVTATATTPPSPHHPETSEFSQDFPSPEASSSSGAAAGPGHTFTVTSTADNAPFTSCPNGPGGVDYTLRCAITDVVSQEKNWGDTIAFNIPSTDPGCNATTGVCTIQLSNPLPGLTSLSTIVDGYTQPGAQPNTLGLTQGDNAALTIQINGRTPSGVGYSYLSGDGLDVLGAHDLARGLSVTGFGGSGVGIDGPAARYDALQGDFLGEAPDGSAVGNLTSGAAIGGTTEPFAALIGGSAPAFRNVLGSNSVDGVFDSTNAGGGGSLSSIQNNYIGTDPTGTLARANNIGIDDEGSWDTIGGADAGEGNVISGNGSQGVYLHQVLSVVEGNEVGTTASGAAALGNQFGGIDLFSGSAVIGGFGPARNVISGNAQDGVGAFSGSNLALEGNDIGTDVSGTNPIPNAVNGVDLKSGSRAFIGAADSNSTPPAPAAPNVIAYNTQAGITVGSGSGDGTVADISQNSIHDNGSVGTPGLGIDIYPSGISCTSSSPPTASSIEPLCPVINSATASSVGGTASTITNSTVSPCSGCAVEVFRATQEADDDVSGTYYGEGKTFLGSTTTDSSGNWTCSTSNGCASGTNPFSGLPVTATLICCPNFANLRTSEFSADVIASTMGMPPAKGARHTSGAGSRDGQGLNNSGARAYVTRRYKDSISGARAYAIRPPRSSSRLYRPSIFAAPPTARLARTHLAPGAKQGKGRARVVGRSMPSAPTRRSAGGTTFVERTGSGGTGVLHTSTRRHAGGGGTGVLHWSPRHLAGSGGTGVLHTSTRHPAGGGGTGVLRTLTRRVARFHAGRQPSIRPAVLGGPHHRLHTRDEGQAHYLSRSLKQALKRLKPLAPQFDGPDPILTVTTRQDVACNDPAGMSLRCAILTANADGSGNPVTIDFDITTGCDSAGFCQISPMAPLPTITRGNVTIDGYSQPGASANTNTAFSQGDNAKVLIGLDGRAYGPNINGLAAAAGNFKLDGVSVKGFVRGVNSTDATVGNEVLLQSPSSGAAAATLSGNVLGGAPSPGQLVIPNVGLQIAGDGGGDIIGGTNPAGINVIAGTTVGVEVCGTPNESVEGNYVGVDATGEAALSFMLAGIQFTGNHTGIEFDNAGGNAACSAGGTSSGGTIGAAGAGNVVSGNAGTGIELAKSTGNTVRGNMIGVDAAGSDALGNGGAGIDVGGANNTIGGTANGQGNVISGNGLISTPSTDGIHMTAGPNTIQGNYIGTDITGAKAIGNVGSGIGIPYVSVSGEVITDNVISANSFDGIFTGCSTGGTIQGNEIGTNAAGTAALANPYGIFMGCEALQSATTIGGTAAADRNLISGNGTGIDSYEQGLTIQGNDIGTDVTGTVAIGNGTGIRFENCGNICYSYDVDDVENELIGGTAAGAGNVIGGNSGAAISFKFCIQNCLIEGNRIGTSPDGSVAVPNSGPAIEIRSYCPCNFTPPTVNVTVGGAAAGAGNLIAHNAAGVVNNPDSYYTGLPSGYPDLGASHVSVQMNQMFDNSGWEGGASPNEIYIGSQGSSCESGGSSVVNDGISCPKITSEVTSSNQVTEIDGQAPTGSTVDVWTATNGIGDAGRGGGQLYLGTVVANGTCAGTCPTGMSGWTLDATSGKFPSCSSGPGCVSGGFSLVPDQPVTATATQAVSGASPPQNETSEFAQDFATITPKDTTVVSNDDGTSPGLPCDTAAGAFISQINLRCAVEEANLAPNQTVTFNLAGGSTTISPTNLLPPVLAQGLTIDGYSQAGSSPNTNAIGQSDNATIKVRIDGTTLGTNRYNSGIYVYGQNEVIKGLSITNFSGAGIEVDGGNGLSISGDFIGVTPSGGAAGNYHGVFTYANYSSGNVGATIGGTALADRNIISGNTDDGVYLFDDNDTVQGNYIGTGPTGDTPVPNGGYGIELDFGQGRLIGGTTPAAANVISGNGSDGIHIYDEASDNTVEGNFIGTDATGTKAVPNGTSPSSFGWCPNDGSGVFLDNGPCGYGGTINNTIGPGNVISGNTANGVELDGGYGGDNNNVFGNLIGLGVNGVHLGNSFNGVYVHDGAGGDAIGGVTAGQGNTIEWNGLSGVTVGSSATDASQASIEGNTIVENVQTGTAGTDNEITLAGENPTGCTADNVAGAPNDDLPCPSNVRVTGTTASAVTCGGCTVDFYTYRAGTNDQDHGGGLTWLGSVTATGACVISTTGSCADNTSVNFTVPSGTSGVVATTTDTNVTSEFSLNSLLLVTVTAASPTVTYGQGDVTATYVTPSSSLCQSGPPNPYCKPRVVNPVVTCTYSGGVTPAIQATGLTTAKPGATAGSYPTSCWGAYDPNYTFSYVVGKLTINPASLTVRATNATVARGAPLPKLGWKANFVNQDTASSLSRQPTCKVNVRAGRHGRVVSPPGTYRIRCAGAKDPNYRIGYASGTLRVTRRHRRQEPVSRLVARPDGIKHSSMGGRK